MSSDNVRSVIVDHRLHSEIIRRSLTGPSAMSMSDREKVAEAIIRDMLGHGDLSKNVMNGQAGEILGTLSNDADWEYLKEAAKENAVLSSYVAASVISQIVSGSSNDIYSLKMTVSDVIDTASVLESIFPGDDFEKYADSVYENLLFRNTCYSELIEKRDILSWIGEIMRFLESDLQNSEKEEHSVNKRDVRILMDTSRSMYGEPEVISKALMLSLAKRMMSENRNVHVVYRSENRTVSFDLSNKEDLAEWFLDILAYRFRSPSGISEMLDDAMQDMRQSSWKNTDLVMISKGLGVRNTMRFTSDWETFREFNDIRTFTLAAGSTEPKGLTELSDHTYPMNSKVINGTEGHYAKLISDMKR